MFHLAIMATAMVMVRIAIVKLLMLLKLVMTWPWIVTTMSTRREFLFAITIHAGQGVRCMDRGSCGRRVL